MADKTIRVSEETWRRLNERKRAGESFDDVIRRLQGDQWQGFGAFSDVGADIRRVHEDLREELETKVERG